MLLSPEIMTTTIYSNTFKDIFKNLDKSLIPCNRFYSAHRKGNDFELLEDHSELCSNYFLHIVDKLGLESILDKFISDVFGEKRLNENKQILSYAIYYHDLGKMNPKFQKRKVKGQSFSGNTKHSFFSERVLSIFLQKKFKESIDAIYLMENIVLNHHGKLADFTTINESDDKEQIEIINDIFKITNIDGEAITEDLKKEFFLNDYEWPKLFLLVKLLYSLLVLSDSYSTMHFTYSLDVMYPLNFIDEAIREKMIKSYLKIPYNTNINTIEQADISQCNDINALRREILIECSKNITKLLKGNEKIFMLSVPTGGGKTNISMKLALDILEHDEKVKKIFYVFPYINIIEQNYEAIDRALFDITLFPTKIGLLSDIYSRAYVNKFQYVTNKDSIPNIKKIMVIRDDNFLNNCVNVITSVNFFNGIIKNGGNNRYKIANLCNSVVIIDEIQTLSDKNFRVFYDFIKETSRNLNIYYIIMSATLPDINDFIEDVKVPQIIDSPEKYFNHPLFKRNTIIFRKDISDMNGIKNLLMKEINENYQSGEVKILLTFNIISTSRKVYNEIISDCNFKNFSIYLLNSTISSLRRKKIIEEIKDKSKKERIIIVSTQSIEAGVDIDCDFGVRDYSILDSIEQISGRINRECNVRKSNLSKLFVIMYKDGSLSDSEKIYRSSDRYKILNRDFNQKDIEDILTYKQFTKYYRVLANELKKIARDPFDHISKEIRDLHFKTINNDLDVIDKRLDQIDIFVCDEIPLKNLSEYDKNKIESIIVDPVIMKFEGIQNIISGEVIFTKNVYRVWKQIMESTDKFEDVYIRRKITSLFNQFIITITNLKNEKTNLNDYLEAEGFIERDDKFNIILSTQKFSECYNFIDGIKTDKFKEGMDNLSLGIII